jgi:uncharacterized protein YqeY
MSLTDKINDDIKSAMKKKDKERLEALRAIKSELLLLKTSGKGEISEEVEIQALQKMVKQRKESAKIYAAEGREELAQKELRESAYIEPYLPEQLSEEEIEAAVKKIIEKTGAEGMKDMGKVMGAAVKELQGKAEGSLIAEKVKALLS